MSQVLKLIAAIISLITALVSAGLFSSDKRPETGVQHEYNAPPPITVDGLNGLDLNPHVNEYPAPPASQIEGLNGLSID